EDVRQHICMPKGPRLDSGQAGPGVVHEAVAIFVGGGAVLECLPNRWPKVFGESDVVTRPDVIANRKNIEWRRVRVIVAVGKILEPTNVRCALGELVHHLAIGSLALAQEFES